MQFKTNPYPHQQKAFDKFKNEPFGALLADMGTGKSKIAIDLASYKYVNGLHDSVLVVALNAVHPQWIDEQFAEHCPVPWVGFSYSSKKTIKFLRKMDAFLQTPTPGKLRVFTMNFEAFSYKAGIEMAKRFFKLSDKPPIIVVDEASRIKNPAAKTTRSLIKLRKMYPHSFRTVLTGTPAAKSPVDMWSIYEFLKDRYMGCSYAAFKIEYSVLVKKKIDVKGRLITIESVLDQYSFFKIKKLIAENLIGGKLRMPVISAIRSRFGLSEQDFWFIYSSPEFAAFKHLDDLLKHIKPNTFSIKKEDCLELPEKIYKKIELTLNAEQKRIIKNLSKYAVAHYNGEELTLNMKAMLGMRVLQICGGFFSHHTDIEGKYEQKKIAGANSKLEYIKQDLPELGNQQFMIWAVFTAEIDLLCEELSKNYAVGRLDGTTPKDVRAEIINDFKAGRLQGLISNPEVGGYGLNLQGAGVQYWYSRNFRTEARLQAEDRSHRIGVTKSPVYKDLVYDVKFEHAVLESLKQGLNINAQFMSNELTELFELI